MDGKNKAAQLRPRYLDKLPSWLIVCTSVALLPIYSSAYAQDDSPLTIINDFDSDGITNTADVDDDNDGIPDTFEIAADGADIDSDADGMPDRLDLDSDNDGILDWIESGATKTLDLSSIRKVGARLSGDVGSNGMLDIFESPLDTGALSYNLSNTDGDALPDFQDLDSDNDGWPDLREAGVAAEFDQDNDARLDLTNSSVGSDGVVDYLQLVNDRACCDLDGDGVNDIIPLNTDLSDLPDYQDLDSDNDGLFDIAELNGQDLNNDGRVDNLVDVAGGADGWDDALLAFPYSPVDANGNGIPDNIDVFSDPTGDLESDDPASAPVDDSPAVGSILTGLNAGGCSITGPGDKNFGFLMLLLLFGGLRLFRFRTR